MQFQVHNFSFICVEEIWKLNSFGSSLEFSFLFLYTLFFLVQVYGQKKYEDYILRVIYKWRRDKIKKNTKGISKTRLKYLTGSEIYEECPVVSTHRHKDWVTCRQTELKRILDSFQEETLYSHNNIWSQESPPRDVLFSYLQLLLHCN